MPMNNLRVWEAVAIASQIGIVFATSVIVGLFAGWYLDSVTHRSPVFTLLGAIAGTASGVYSVAQLVKFIQNKRESK